MIYAAHQPDLLPYSGFFYKMAKADVFEIKIWDQFVEKGYQRRAIMRERWANLPMVKTSPTDPIFDKLVKPEAAQELAKQIEQRYGGNAGTKKAQFWNERGPQVMDEVLSIKTDRLWEFNFRLILFIRDLLGITTPLGLGQPVQEGLRGSAGIVTTIQAWPGVTTYLSGTGARTYMGDCHEFTEAGIDVIWSNHQPVTGDSILSVLFDYEDPLSIVLQEKVLSEVGARA